MTNKEIKAELLGLRIHHAYLGQVYKVTALDAAVAALDGLSLRENEQLAAWKHKFDEVARAKQMVVKQLEAAEERARELEGRLAVLAPSAQGVGSRVVTVLDRLSNEVIKLGARVAVLEQLHADRLGAQP